MEWSSFILFLVSLFAGFRCYKLSKNDIRLKFLGLTIALFVLALTQLSLLIEQFAATYDTTIYAETIVEWGHVIILAFVLSSLTIFIRHSKPVFAQFPRIYAILPFFIVLSYFLVSDTYAIKDWLLIIYQAGAMLVALLMYSVYTYRNADFKFILSGIIIFFITFVLFWYIPVINESFAWIWKSLLAAGIITIIYGYEYIDTSLIKEDTMSVDPQSQKQASL